ncbi:hypothetical protein NYE24_15845 [Paenibacillus sp. FSL H7-0350]|uniref:hypothetical protein n=1 Tax=Paenibacillus sp. FSL H7-0350 TaxID=2975345 RepID=UPI0031597889
MKEMRTPFFFSTAIFGEYMANLFQSSYYLGINSLHSFKSYSEEEYSNFEKKFNFISNKTLYYDRDYIHDFVELVKQLYETNDICIMNKPTAVCECGRAEMTQSELNRFSKDNVGMQLIENREGELTCRYCEKKLILDNHESLYLSFKEIELSQNTEIYPSYLDSDFNHFRKSLLNSQMRISRVRNTGVSAVINNRLFYLDIDFLWKTIPLLLCKQHVVVVASVKHMFSLFIINYLAQIIKRNKVYFIGLPFIETESVRKDVLHFLSDEKHRKALKLLVLLGVGWSQKNIRLQDSTCKYFMSSRLKNDELFEFLSNVSFDTNQWHEMCELITLHTQLQNVLQLKKKNPGNYKSTTMLNYRRNI